MSLRVYVRDTHIHMYVREREGAVCSTLSPPRVGNPSLLPPPMFCVRFHAVESVPRHPPHTHNHTHPHNRPQRRTGAGRRGPMRWRPAPSSSTCGSTGALVLVVVVMVYTNIYIHIYIVHDICTYIIYVYMCGWGGRGLCAVRAD